MKITAHYRFVQPEESIALCARNGRCLLYTSWRISVARLRSSRNLTLEGTGLSLRLIVETDLIYGRFPRHPNAVSSDPPLSRMERVREKEADRQTNQHAGTLKHSHATRTPDTYIYTHREQKETRIHERRHAVFVISDTRCSEGFLVFA